jgi:peptide/nickel transport system substrate-binding protein
VTESTPSAPSTPSEAPQYRKRNRSKKPLIITVVLLVVAAALAATIFWLNQDQGSAAENGDVEGNGVPTTPSALTVGLQLEPTNLDIRNTGGVALDQILIDNVYQGLVGLSSGSVDEFVPVLAESLPTVSTDALTYTFSLREGVSFASGNALTIDDVVDSLSSTLVAEVIGTDATVSALDADTLEIHLSSPNSQFLWHLANRPGLIFETAFTGDLAHSTNGTGPFTLEQWIEGDSITFVAVTDYWGDAPTLDEVVWRYIPDANAALNAALEGDLDVLAPVRSDMVSQFDGSDFSLERAASTDVFTLAYNNAKAPLDDVRVRSALSMAIDSDSIIAAFYGDGVALGGPITDIEPAYEDLTGVHRYDPEGAKALLAEAGVSDLALTVTVANFYDTAALNQIVTQFAEVGVTLSIHSVEFGTWLNDVYASKDFDLSYVNHAEANDFVNYANPGYYFGYNNPEVQSLYSQSVAATTSDEATGLLQQAARIVASDAPVRWLINYTPTNATAGHVSGFPDSNTNSRINLAGVSVTAEHSAD